MGRFSFWHCDAGRGPGILSGPGVAPERRAGGQTAGREMQPEAWAAFPNRLFRWRAVAPGARRSNGKSDYRAAIAPLPGGNGAAAGMGTGFYIGLSYLVRGDAVDWGCQVSVMSGLVVSGEVKWVD